MGGSATASVVGAVALVGILAVLIWALVAYRQLVELRDDADTSWAQIDVQLKRRHDLTAHLVQMVHVYAPHERGLLEEVVAARADAIDLSQGAGPSRRVEAEAALSRALGRLLAVAEAHPGLKADPNYAMLHVELANAEDKIVYTRHSFSEAAEAYNGAVRAVPTGLIARLGGFRPRELFQPAGERRHRVRARF